MDSVSSSVPQETPAPLDSSSKTFDTKAMVFHGNGGDYFSIWIVNLLLTIVTLGIYSAWAKVRTMRYFYSNTEIDGHRFTYLAQPLQILKGRIIAVVIFIAFYAASTVTPIAAVIGFLLLVGFTPWFICKSLQFNMRMTSYRNVRFNFHGEYGRAFAVFFFYPALNVFTLYLATPLIAKKVDEFICDNISFGDERIVTRLSTGTYYKASVAAVLSSLGIILILGFLVGVSLSGGGFEEVLAGADFKMQAIIMLAYLAIFIVVGSLYTSIIRNHLFNNSEIEDVAKFKSTVTFSSLVWLRSSNLALLIFTLGLAIPWVKVRRSQYFCEKTEVAVLPGANQVIADESQGPNAIGDEVAEIFDFDVAVG